MEERIKFSKLKDPLTAEKPQENQSIIPEHQRNESLISPKASKGPKEINTFLSIFLKKKIEELTFGCAF